MQAKNIEKNLELAFIDMAFEKPYLPMDSTLCIAMDGRGFDPRNPCLRCRATFGMGLVGLQREKMLVRGRCVQS